MNSARIAVPGSGGRRFGQIGDDEFQVAFQRQVGYVGSGNFFYRYVDFKGLWRRQFNFSQFDGTRQVVTFWRINGQIK